MNEIGNNITFLGLIATIVSLIFAAAALMIARRRKMHQSAQRNALHPPPAPRPLNLPPAVQPEQPRPLSKTPASAAEPVGSAAGPTLYETSATSSPLFKRLGRHGVENATVSPEQPADNQLDWE